jgi:O-methyltransferase
MTNLDVSLRKRVSHLLLPRYSELLDRMNWSAKWIKTVRENAGSARFANREEMYRHLNEKHFGAGTQAIDYFEFGVFEGKSMALWSALNSHPASRFFGFDSFEGLPETWNRKRSVGSYSAHGKVPASDDARVEFISGWFQKSLPFFLASHEPKNPILMNNDSDLYSSTLYALTAMNGLLLPGTIVIFDEFYDPLHEYRALCDYSAAYMRKFEIIAATGNFTQVAVRIS